MTEMILELAALFLALFCLIGSIRQNRALRMRITKDLPDVYGHRQKIFFVMQAAVIAAASVSAAESASGADRAGTADAFRTVILIARIVFFVGFALYILFLLKNRSAGHKGKILAAFSFAGVGIAGVIIQAVWSVRVELFFEAVALFGCIILIEQDTETDVKRLGHRIRRGLTIAIAALILVMLISNITLILNIAYTQNEEIGTVRIGIIREDLQDTIKKAERDLSRIVFSAEKMIKEDASRKELTAYFYEQRDQYRLSGSFLNAYIAGSDWHIIPGYVAPEGFHAAESMWYRGAMDSPGKIYISDPYNDPKTGTMCFTVASVLSDGETVVAADLDFSGSQELIRDMTQRKGLTGMLITSSGLIAGCNDDSLIGKYTEEVLPEYNQLIERVVSSKEHESFRAELGGRPHIVFSTETENGWYLILTADAGELFETSYRQMAVMASVNLLMLVVVIVYYILSAGRIRLAEQTLDINSSSIETFSGRIRETGSLLQRLGDVRLYKENDITDDLFSQIRESGQKMSAMADELSSYSRLIREKNKEAGWKNRTKNKGVPSRKVRNAVLAVLVIALVIVLGFSINISINRVTLLMNREADSYENKLNEWMLEQKGILYMLTDVISSRPELMAEYDSAVKWLDGISSKYPEIAFSYLANPYAEHILIMNNGWEPGEDFRLEERPWYIETERSAEGFSMSEPYIDVQTGKFCVTMSRMVYGEKNEFIGIFGIDFFLDTLISHMNEGYTGQGYAFLVDSHGMIVNHPNEAYQLKDGAGTWIGDTEYADAFDSGNVTVFFDYDSELRVCASRASDFGFTVIAADNWWDVFGGTVLSAVIFLSLFIVSIIVVVTLINRLIRWQEEANRQLAEAADSAESANRAKSRFLSQMSHEIRTPMNAIIGLDTIALRDETISPRTRDELEKIGASARHLLALINDILDMSRIESGRMTLKNERFSFREFLDQINIIISGQCAEKGLQFVCNKTEPLDEYFIGDDLKLKQVLINILGNSVKFTDPPGVITFTIRQTDGPEAGCAVLTFTMEDTGIGMDKEFIPKLFEAFSQEDSGNTNRYGGSGLGMAITKSIVEMMGGGITVESEKGLGSTFIVTVTLSRVTGSAVLPEESEESGLKLAEKSEETGSMLPKESEETPGTQSAERQEKAAVKRTARGMHLMIAEDQAINAEILTDLLELEDISTEWAENGQKAVELFESCEKGHFDAILMDMRMPVMDGLDATRTIRRSSHPDAASIPIIALTANAFAEDVKQCLDAGMNEHLSKPVDVEVLKEVLLKYT